MKKITPFLWFNDNAEDAVNFYIAVFENAKVKTVTRYSHESAMAAGRPEGSVMTVAFTLQGQDFTAINGGPVFKFTPAISFVVNCKNQKEIDYFWENLSEGGKKLQCGWLEDKYGVSWQIVPVQLGKIMQHDNSNKAMEALMKMDKIDLNILKQALREG